MDNKGNQETKNIGGRRETRIINDEELEKIKKAAKSLQEKIVVYLLIETGLRRGDIAKLKIQNIKWEKRWIQIVQQKTEKEAHPQITKDLLSWLETYVYDNLRAKKKGWLFPSPRRKNKPLSGKQIYNIFKRVCDRAEVKNVSPHDLRATKITRQVARGFSDKYVADELGVSIRTTKRHYEKYPPELLRKLADEKEKEEKRR